MKHAPTTATREGTQRYASRWRAEFVEGFYRASYAGLNVSSVALGTYLGESDDETDMQYAEAIRHALSSGINAIDTAINYRCQRSERVVGEMLRALVKEGVVGRDEIVIGTKAGYLPLDTVPPASRDEYSAYVRGEYLDRGVLREEELVAGGHAIAPRFLVDQLHRSLRNLGVAAVDFFYVHNPEQQLAEVSPVELSERLRLAFAALEECVSRGEIGVYGCSTWTALRLPAGSAGHLSLYELAAIAKDVGGENHHFRVVQLPINLSMSEAVRVSTQRDPRGRLVHVVEAASELGIDLVASAPLLQGKLTRDLPDAARGLFPGATDADRAIAFVRTLPSVLTAAVGMRHAAHVQSNLAGIRAS